MFDLLSIFAALPEGCRKSFLGLPHWYEYLDTKMNAKCQVIDLKIPDDLLLIALAVVGILLRVAALIAVGYVLYGGIQYITSEGKPDRVGHAQQTIINALIGLATAIIAAPFVGFIARRITGG